MKYYRDNECTYKFQNIFFSKVYPLINSPASARINKIIYLSKHTVINMEDEVLVLYSYVKISSYRERVVRSLAKQNMFPKDIAHDSGIRPNHISQVLRELKDKGIVECTNEHKRKYRNYQLTDLGMEIAKELK